MVEDYWKLKPLVAKKNQASFKSDYWKIKTFSGPSSLGLIDHKSKKNLTYPEAKKKYNLSPFGDADKDGVRNIFDCRPFDPSRQDNPIGSAWKKHKEKKKAKQMKEAEDTLSRIQKEEAPKQMYFEEKPEDQAKIKIKEHKVTLRESFGQAKENVGASIGQLKKFGKKVSSSKAFAESGIKREAKIRGTTEEEIERIIDKVRKKRQLSKEDEEKLKLYQIKHERQIHKKEVLEKAKQEASKFVEGPKEFPKTPIAGQPIKGQPEKKATFPTQPQTYQEQASQEIAPVYELPEGPKQVPYTSRLTPTIRTEAIDKRIKKTQRQEDIFPQPKESTAFELLRAEETARRELGIERPLPPVGGVDLTTGEPHRVQRYSPVTLRQSFVVSPFVKKPEVEAPEFGQSRPSGRKIGDTIFSSMTSPRQPSEGPFGTSRIPGQLIVSNLAPKGERSSLPYSTLSPKGGRSPLPHTNLEPKKGLTPFKFITFDFRKQGGYQQ